MDSGWHHDHLVNLQTEDQNRGHFIKRCLVVIMFLNVTCLPAWASTSKIGTVYKDRPGEIAVLFEAVPDVTLHPSDFQLLLGNQSVVTAKEIKTFDRSGKDLALAICVDISGPMGEEKLKDLKAALFYLIGMAANRPEDRIALIFFADEIKAVPSFQQTREQLVEAAMQLQAGGSSTRLYHALYKTLDLFEGQDLPKRRRIIVVSDGKDQGSVETLENVTTKATALNVAIDGVSQEKIDPMLKQIFIGKTELVGGRFIETHSENISLKEGVAGLYKNLLDAPSWMVYFSYDANLTEKEPQDASIKISLPGQQALVIDIPGKYAPPKQMESKAPEIKETLPPAKKREIQPPASQEQSWLSQNRFLASTLALAATLVLAVIIFLSLRRSKRGNKLVNRETATTVNDEPRDDTVVSPVTAPVTPAPDTVVSPVSAPRTMVGGYIYPPPEPGKPSADLVGIDGPLINTCCAINKKMFSIGSAEENDYCISKDDYVSRNHAYLRYERGSLFVFDSGSRGGTFVNQKQIVDTSVALEPGDQIKIGQSTFEVRKHFGEQTEG